MALALLWPKFYSIGFVLSFPLNVASLIDALSHEFLRCAWVSHKWARDTRRLPWSYILCRILFLLSTKLRCPFSSSFAKTRPSCRNGRRRYARRKCRRAQRIDYATFCLLPSNPSIQGSMFCSCRTSSLGSEHSCAQFARGCVFADYITVRDMLYYHRFYWHHVLILSCLVIYIIIVSCYTAFCRCIVIIIILLLCHLMM